MVFLVPKYIHSLMINLLQFKVKLTMACLMPEDRGKFFVYTRFVSLLNKALFLQADGA